MMLGLLYFLIITCFSAPAVAFDRLEQKCLDSGYAITTENCGKQTAPEDVCPYNENFFKICSQAAWCRKQGYTYTEADCTRPNFASDICPNNYPLYKQCLEDIDRVCKEDGYSSAAECSLSDERCPYSQDYGKCCSDCAEYPFALEDLPRGYVQDGDICRTCNGKIRIKVKPTPCDDFLECPLGPASEDTPSCLSGEKTLYKSCQNAEIKCHAAGYTQNSCLDSEDATYCPDDKSFMSCKINCEKLARLTFPNAQFITEDTVNPELNSNFTEIRSYLELDNPLCQKQQRPIVTLNLSPANIDKYKKIFNLFISGIDFKINMQNGENLDFNGHLQNSRLIFTGQKPKCLFNSGSGSLGGEVEIKGAANICNSFSLTPNTHFHLAANLKGDIKAEGQTKINITRNMEGLLHIGSHAHLQIGGRLIIEDKLNTDFNTGSMVIGCDSHALVKQGIELNTSNLILKNNSQLSTPQITLISKSDMMSLPNMLSVIHLYPESLIFHDLDDNNQLEIANNTAPSETCHDKYVIYLGSSFDENLQRFSIQADDKMDEQWQCQEIPEENKLCD